MSSLDLFFRIGNAVLLVLLALVLIKDHRTRPSAILGAIVALGAAAMGMFAISNEWELLLLEVPLNLLGAAALIAFWLLSKSLFEDGFQWKWWYLLVYVVYALFGLVGHYITFGDFRGMAHWIIRSDVAHNGLGLIPVVTMGTVLVLLTLYSALKDWRVDLVESRRRARRVSLLLGGIIILVITFVEFFSLGTPRSILLDTMVSGFFFLIIFGIFVRFLGFRHGQPAHLIRLEFPSESLEEDNEPGIVIIQELQRMMGEEKIYCQEGLTIRRLADELNVKEYKLRRAINGYLGYRNFNQFLNLYRVEEAARQLTAPRTRHLPVISIALDVGYQSLTPFNKAFKEIKGMTPTEYRNRNIPTVAVSDPISSRMSGR